MSNQQLYTINALLMRAISELPESSSPRLDAELLLAHALQKDRSWLFSHSGNTLKFNQIETFEKLLKQRKEGHPIAYILGHREFWSMDLVVNEHVLIPRPETELLVEKILENYPQKQLITLADLGTGSGAIALAIAKERPHWNIYATDRMNEALKTASLNAKNLKINNINFSLGFWCEALPLNQKFDIIVSNPPYIMADDPHLVEGDVRFEPLSALVSENKGLADIQTIAEQSFQKLKSGGSLWIEHGYNQSENIRTFFQKVGYKEIISYFDFNQIYRITGTWKP